MAYQDHHNIQCTLVPIIADMTCVEFVSASCSFVDFIYLAQSVTHSKSSIAKMQQVLAKFHLLKHSILMERGLTITSSTGFFQMFHWSPFT